MFLVFYHFLTICRIQIIIMIFAAGFFYTLYVFQPEPILSTCSCIFCCVPLLCCSYYCWKWEDFLLFVPYLSFRCLFYSSGWFSFWLYTVAYWELRTMNIKTCYTSHFCMYDSKKKEAKMPFLSSQSFQFCRLFGNRKNCVLWVRTKCSKRIYICIVVRGLIFHFHSFLFLWTNRTTVWLNNFIHTIFSTTKINIHIPLTHTHSLRSCQPSVLGIW